MPNRFIIKMLLNFFCFISISSEVEAFSYEIFSSGFFTTIHVLTVNPQEHAIRPVKALEGTRETVATLAIRHQACAAINGGFWKNNGDPAGILKIDHCWYAVPTKPRGAIGWAQNGKKVLIDRVLTNCTLKGYLEENRMKVLSASNPPKTTSEEWDEMEHIVGGAPVLISGGNRVEDYGPEQTTYSFLKMKHPRTAVGIKNNGDWVFVVADCYLHRFFGGMTAKALAEFMHELGCIDALNLDGGDSSTLFINGAVVNDTCGNVEENGKWVRPVSDAILIMPNNDYSLYE